MPQNGERPSGSVRDEPVQAPSHQADRTRCRIHFGKQGVLRYTSHLDLARIWERTLRRASVPLCYSQGFNPRPQMQLAAALPLGCESTCEMLDIFVMGEVSPEQMTDRLRAAVPEGLEVFRIEVVDLNGPALQTLIRAAVYEIVLSEPVTARGLQAQITEMLSQPAIERTRRGKVYDLRPLIRSLAVESRGAEAPVILAEVVFSQHEGTGRPDEIISALGFDPLAARITRVKLALGDS